MEGLPKSTPTVDRKMFDDMFSISVLYNSVLGFADKTPPPDVSCNWRRIFAN